MNNYIKLTDHQINMRVLEIFFPDENDNNLTEMIITRDCEVYKVFYASGKSFKCELVKESNK